MEDELNFFKSCLNDDSFTTSKDDLDKIYARIEELEKTPND